MNKFMAILGLAIVALLSPMAGQEQVCALHRSHFKIHNLSARQDSVSTWVHGEITSNAEKESSVSVIVRWFDKNGDVVNDYNLYLPFLAPGETLPFKALAKKNPAIVRYDITVVRYPWGLFEVYVPSYPWP